MDGPFEIEAKPFVIEEEKPEAKPQPLKPVVLAPQGQSQATTAAKPGASPSRDRRVTAALRRFFKGD